MVPERGGEPESFASLGELVGRLSEVQRGLFGTSLNEARQVDCLPELLKLLERGDKAGALAVLAPLVDAADGVALAETTDDACRRLAFALRQTLSDVAGGKTAGLDEVLAFGRLRLESAADEVRDADLTTVLLEHDPSRLDGAYRSLEARVRIQELAPVRAPSPRDDDGNVVPGGPLCPDLFADGRWAYIELATQPKHPTTR